jgi:hypothetical protein
MPLLATQEIERLSAIRFTREGQHHHGRHGHDRIHHGCLQMSVGKPKPDIPRPGVSQTTGVDSQLGSELARRTALLALTSVTASVAALPVATVTATATASAEPPLTALLAAKHATGRGVRPLLLDVGGRDNLGGEVQPLPEVVETLGGQGVVVVLPRELGLDVAARGQRLARLDDEEVADAGLVSRLIAAGSNELASAGLFEDVKFGFVIWGMSRIVAERQHLARWDNRTWFLMEFGGPTSSQRP